MSKQFMVVLAAIVVILGGIVVVSNQSKHNATSGAIGQPTHHVKGSSPGGVTLVEYGDYQCPVCGIFEPTVEQVVAKYSDRMIFQFRNLPLTSLHQNAYASSRAAEAADLQGKFWEMHGSLYQHQTEWQTANDPLSLYDTYAKQLGLNVTQFNKDYASEQVNGRINADLAAFAKTGDQMATPTFYLDGKKLDNGKLFGSNGQPDTNAFSKVIDAELTQKTPSSKQ